MQADSWDAIERIAQRLGIGPEALRKWRIRGVPRAWRLDVLRADVRHEINEADFDNPPGPRRLAARRIACEVEPL
jgi:transposase-like protein